MELTGNTFFFPWEVSLMEWLQNTLGGSAAGVVSFLSAFGEEIVMILVMGVLYWWYDKKTGKNVGLNILTAMVWNTQIKNLFIRRRPYMDHEGVKILRIVEPAADPMDIAAQGYSFPSGHSTNGASAFAGLGVELRKKWMTVLAVLLPLLIGFSRIFVGAHYPTDVLGGWALGLLAVLAVTLLRRKVKNEYAVYGILLATALPGLFFCRSEDYFTALGLMIGFIAGCLFEERKTRFENTRSFLFGALRIAGGFAVYFGLNLALKKLFSAAFPGAGETAGLYLRALRYAVIAFIEFGVYPMLFRPFEGLISGKK